MGRALTGNMLVGTTAEEDIADQLKEAYNRADPGGWPAFATEIARNLALYDSFDGVRGNQWLADGRADAPEPYKRLAQLLADDRLWVDTRHTRCREYLAVERSAFGQPMADCGGRTPNHNVNGVFRSLLIRGSPDGVDDGVDHDDHVHSTVEFPFLAAPDEPVATTDASVALANLDQLIEQAGQDPAGVDLLLTRMQFLADHGVLDRVKSLTEGHAGSANELLHRAHARAAAHRFSEALADLELASRLGAPENATRAQRASVLSAMGRADEALPWLRDRAASAPGFASHVALAQANAAAGHPEEADALYERALAEIDTTLPFPAAAVWFARGLMWAEQLGDSARGAAMYEQALRLVPQYVPANLHLAELQAAHGNTAEALAHLDRIVAVSRDPESLALLGTLHRRTGEATRGDGEIRQAQACFEELLRRHPQAFADHAAEFYLDAGADPERALHWARINLLARETPRAFALAIRAARSAHRPDEARDLEARRDASLAAHRVASSASIGS
jgi:tetratricopeptide (TPR) repeat protein